MIPDPDSNSKNAPAVINNLRNKLMWATQIHYSVLPKHTSDDRVYFCDWQQQQRWIILSTCRGV